jgi:hypothetical protein
MVLRRAYGTLGGVCAVSVRGDVLKATRFSNTTLKAETYAGAERDFMG